MVGEAGGEKPAACIMPVGGSEDLRCRSSKGWPRSPTAGPCLKSWYNGDSGTVGDGGTCVPPPGLVPVLFRDPREAFEPFRRRLAVVENRLAARANGLRGGAVEGEIDLVGEGGLGRGPDASSAGQLESPRATAPN